MISYKLENSLSIIGGMVTIFHIIFCSKGIIFIELIDVCIDVAQMGTVHLRNCILWQIGIIFFCPV